MITTRTTEKSTCQMFIPLMSEIYGPTIHCGQCGKLESAHADPVGIAAAVALVEDRNAPAPARTPGEWTAIANADAGPFKYTIIARETMTVVAQVFARRWKNRAKVVEDPEADANAALLKTAPKLLAALKRARADLIRSIPTGMSPPKAEREKRMAEIEAVIAEAEGRA